MGATSGESCPHAVLEQRDRSIALLAWVLITATALALRIRFLSANNLDLVDHFLPWLEDIRQRGFWTALAAPFSAYGYTPFYSYALGFANWLAPAATDGKVVIKLVSICFDFIAAGLVSAIAYERWRDLRAALLAYAALLFAPTVVLNGAYWGQSDIVYGSFLLASMLCVLQQRYRFSVLCFSFALAIKLQAIWFAPFLLVLVLKQRIRWVWLAMVPITYVVLALPALWVGRSLTEIATIYLTQAGTQSMLCYSAANLQIVPQYIFVHEKLWPEIVPLFAKLSIVFAAGVSLFYATRASRQTIRSEQLLLAALGAVMIAPMLLPHMHNRYFFPSDLLSLALVVWRPAYWRIFVACQLSSVITYVSFLWGESLLAHPVPDVLAMLGASNNLQIVTGLEVLAALVNLAVLIWCWKKLGVIGEAASDASSGNTPTVTRTPIGIWQRLAI